MMAPDQWHVRRFLQMCVQFCMIATNVEEGGHSKSSMAQKSTEKLLIIKNINDHAIEICTIFPLTGSTEMMWTLLD